MSSAAKAFLVVVGMAALLGIAGSCTDGMRRREKAEIEAKLLESRAKAEAAALASRRSACAASSAETLAEYEMLMKERKFGAAGTAIRDCAEATGDPALKERVDAAEFEERLSVARNRKEPPRDREVAISVIERDYAERAGAKTIAPLRAEINRAVKEAEARERAAEAKRKRSEGVSIGMSEEDVLASSWGKPDHINRTTNAWGTREQWVYGGGGYLYFRNGVLESIQN